MEVIFCIFRPSGCLPWGTFFCLLPLSFFMSAKISTCWWAHGKLSAHATSHFEPTVFRGTIELILDSSRKTPFGTGAMAQQVRVCAALVKDLRAVPSTDIRRLTTAHSSRPTKPEALFWLLRAPAHTVTQAHTRIISKDNL